jgi:uncharacterized membrane protein YesL
MSIEGLPPHLRVIAQAASDWWDDLVNLVVINLIWVVCWLTVVLGPPATLGIYHVANRLVRGESLGPQGLLEGAKRYFLQSWLWMLFNLVVAAIVLVNWGFYASFDAGWADLMRAFFLLLGLFWLAIQFYALPYLVEQERKNVGIALRNGLFNALAAPGYTLVVFAFAVLVVGLSVGLVFPLFLGGPCLIAVVGNRAVIERLATYGVREREMASREADTVENDDNSS